jgi:hypothetical protein
MRTPDSFMSSYVAKLGTVAHIQATHQAEISKIRVQDYVYQKERETPSLLIS